MKKIVCNENFENFSKNTNTDSCRVGVLNGKYDLAGSEFEIWPSNYNLDVGNVGHILNSDPARSYFPLE